MQRIVGLLTASPKLSVDAEPSERISTSDWRGRHLHTNCRRPKWGQKLGKNQPGAKANVLQGSPSGQGDRGNGKRPRLASPFGQPTAAPPPPRDPLTTPSILPQNSSFHFIRLLLPSGLWVFSISHSPCPSHLSQSPPLSNGAASDSAGDRPDHHCHAIHVHLPPPHVAGTAWR